MGSKPTAALPFSRALPECLVFTVDGHALQNSAEVRERVDSHADLEPADLDATDGLLVSRAASGDLQAFNAIVERYQRQVFAVCMNLMRDRMAAEDVTQDTFIRAWSAISTFHGDSAKSWLLRIASNRCLDVLRQRRRLPTSSLDAQMVEFEPRWSSLVGADSPETNAEQLELNARLSAALGDLPEDQRVALLMADVLGYDYLEIAELTSTAIGTVKSRISRARGRLRLTLLSDADSREHFDRFARS
jgi:RNA polymerase sigma-70 factor (ECF subfamily)